MRALAQHGSSKVEAMAHGGLHCTAMRLVKGMDDLSHWTPLERNDLRMLRTDRNRGHQVSAKHGSFGQALENLLQGHGLSVSNCSAMTYTLPPLNALRAFEAAARHLSFKLAAHELHVTPAAVGQQVKALEVRLGVRLFERLHKQLVLTAAGQVYLPEISRGFRRIANATAQLKPAGGGVLLQLGLHASFDLRRLALAEFRATHAGVGLRVL